MSLSEEELLKEYAKGWKKSCRIVFVLSVASWRVQKMPFPISWIFAVIYFVYYMAFYEKCRRYYNKELVGENPTIEQLRKIWDLHSMSSFVRFASKYMEPKVKIQQDIYIKHNGAKIRCVLFSDVSFEDALKSNKLILHIHGGGFCAMSPEAHQMYLKVWARKLKVPILSVDYSLSPEKLFPTALEECAEVYSWCLKNFRSTLQQLDPDFSDSETDESDAEEEPLRIVITGDSAGGNLTVTVALKIIVSKEPIPAGLVITYPVIDLGGHRIPEALKKYNVKRTPSKVLYKNDLILRHQFMALCEKSYVRKDEQFDSIEEYFASPILAPKELFAQFPQTFVHVGNMDPLFDDSVVLQHLLKDAKVDSELKIFENIAHGYLNMIGTSPEAKKANDIVMEKLATFLES